MQVEDQPTDGVTCHLKSKLLTLLRRPVLHRRRGERARFGAYALDRRAAEAVTCPWPTGPTSTRPPSSTAAPGLVGWAIVDHTRTDLVTDALHAAANTRGSLAEAIFHSDHGPVYTFRAYAQRCQQLGVTQSIDEPPQLHAASLVLLSKCAGAWLDGSGGATATF